jgi:hypothetical protein
MAILSKFSAISLALGLSFSGAASATGNVWDSANPWGSSTLSQNAEWAVFNGYPTDTTPDVATSGAAASLTETTGAGFLTGGGNIYSFAAPTAFTATLAGSTTGFYDVYLRVGVLGTLPLADASLNGTLASQVIAFTGGSGSGFGGAEQESYWKWSNVAGAANYSFNFGATESSLSLDQLQLATVSVGTIAAVPEPETYSMLIAGLGLMGFVARRRKDLQA